MEKNNNDIKYNLDLLKMLNDPDVIKTLGEYYINQMK